MKKIILAALFLFLVAGVYGVGYSEDGSGFATFGGVRMCMADGSVPLSGTWDFSNVSVSGIAISNFTSNVDFFNTVNFFGTNTTGGKNTIDLIGRNGGDDGTGASKRIELNFWVDDDASGANNRVFSVQTHSNYTQEKQITFYANVRNGSYAGKVLEFFWGEDTNNVMYLRDIKQIHFSEESEKGYYQNKTTNNGITSDNQFFFIELDSNADSNEAKFHVKNSTNTFFKVEEDAVTSLLKLRVDGGSLASFGTPSSVAIGVDDSNTGIYKSDFNNFDIATNGQQRMNIDGSGNINFNILQSTYTGGQAYVCVNDAGDIFSSETAC